VNLLLDTHVPRTDAALQRSATQVSISAVSIWEISVKLALGRLKFTAPSEESIATLLERACRQLPVTHRHAFAVRGLPLHHADPFDRMLVAQVRCEDLILVTANRAIAVYDVRTLDAGL
jgi:PIN domain nuclease of toxin-antitoxin system